MVAFLLALLAADLALADDSFVLVTGRRDPRIYAIDLNAALRSTLEIARYYYRAGWTRAA